MKKTELLKVIRQVPGVPAEVLSALTDRLKPAKRGRKPRTGETELAEKIALIEQVEALTAQLGTRDKAFETLATRHKTSLVLSDTIAEPRGYRNGSTNSRTCCAS